MSKKFKINRIPFIFFLGLLILAIFYALYVEISFAGENSEYFAYSYGELSYKHKVKVTLNSDKKIVKVEDDSTVPNPRDQYYWNKYLNGKGFDKFEGLDVEKVKKMEIWKGEFAGKDAVAGATMSSEAVQKAVIYAIGRSRDRTITYNGYYHPDIGEGGVYTLKLDNDLPKDYKPVLEKVTYGIFRSKDAKEIIGLNLSEDGSKITFKEKLKPGYYCLSIKDANNKYPSFDWKIEHANQYIYPEFAFYTGNDGSGVNYENGKISPTSPQLTVEDLRNNVEDIDITDVETNQTVEVPLAHPEEGANTEYINGEYAKNQFFTNEGKINNNFTVNGKKVFMPGKKYKIRVYFWNVWKGFNTEYTAPTPEVPQPPKPKYTDKVTVKGVTYRIIDKKKKTAEVFALKKNIKKVDIAGSVKIYKKNYKVVSIADRTFKNKKNIRKVVLSKNIIYIGKEAFFNTKNLKMLIIKGTKIKVIKKKALKKTHKKIVVKAPKKVLKKYSKLLKKAGISKTAKMKKL